MEFQVLTHLYFFAYLSGSGNSSSRSNSRSIPGKVGGRQARDMTGLAIDGQTGHVLSIHRPAHFDNLSGWFCRFQCMGRAHTF